MDKQDFFKLTLEEQINFFNYNLKNGISINSICNDLNISKSIVTKFKNHRYIFKNNQYVKQDMIKNKENDDKNDDKDYFKRTVTVHKDVWKNFKIQCIREDKKTSEMVEELIYRYLNKKTTA